MSGGDRGVWRRFADVVAFLFMVGTSASSLGGWTAGTTQLVLRVVAVISAFYLLYLLVAWSVISRNERVTAAELSQDIEDVVTRHAASNEESVFVEVIIGRADHEDQVKEEIRVRPNPQVVHRLIRPIVPDHRRMPRRLTDIDFTCTVEPSDDGAVLVKPRPLRTKDYLQIWLIFVPSLTKPTTWRFEYRPKGLWRVLRETNQDRLVWHDTMPPRSPMVDFRIRFVFADPGFKPGVRERSNIGTAVPPVQRSTGEWILEWHDPSPQGSRYEWTITRVPRR